VIYLIATVGLLAMLTGIYWTGHKSGTDGQKKIDEPLIAQAQADKQLAVQANQSLQRDLETVRGDVDTCNTRVAGLKADSDIAIATMDKIIKDSEARRKAYTEALARFNAAARPATPVRADLQCEAARAALGELSDQMKMLDALGLNSAVTAPAAPRLTVTPTPTPPTRRRGK
jgi:hypothetical protein